MFSQQLIFNAFEPKLDVVMGLKALLLVIPAMLLLGCCGLSCIDQKLCPMYIQAPPWYYEQCQAKGGHMQADSDPFTCCSSPPYCAAEDGSHITITPPSPTPTPIITPTPTPSEGELQRKCNQSNGTWVGNEWPYQCTCGNSSIYNRTSGFCERCAPGERAITGPFGENFCLMPSGHEGEPCDRESDCGTGNCALVNGAAVTGRGICRDLMFGCNSWIDNEGNAGPELCVD